MYEDMKGIGREVSHEELRQAKVIYTSKQRADDGAEEEEESFDD